MLETFMATALGRWLASRIATIGVVGLLILTLVGGYFYHQYSLASLKQENTELDSKNKILDQQVTTLTEVNRKLNQELELKQKSDKLSDAISVDEDVRKDAVQSHTDESVTRIQKAYHSKGTITSGTGLKLHLDQTTGGGTTEVTTTYEPPAEVAIDELWKGYCTDMRGSDPECKKPAETKG